MSSKYDFVKVKVAVGSGHYYVLSRYLLSRMLTFSEVPSINANRIALRLKKTLVDNDELEITQQRLEEVLFQLMRENEFGRRNIRLFKVMTHFYTERVPLIVLIAGSGCTGKSSVAHALGSRLNNHHVVDCEVMLESLMAARLVRGGADSAAGPLWFLDCSLAEIVEEWRRRCLLVLEAVAGDIEKALCEGKVLILEGTLLNLPLFAEYVTRATASRGIFVAFVLASPAPKDCHPMVEGWLASKAHFASHLSIPQLHRLMLERFDAVHDAHMTAIRDAHVPLRTEPPPPPQAPPGDSSALEDLQLSKPRRPLRHIDPVAPIESPFMVQLQPDSFASVVGDMHATLLAQIIPQLLQRRAE